MEKPIIAMDTETFLIGPYQQAPKIVCVSWCIEEPSLIYGKHHSAYIFKRYVALPTLKERLEQAANGEALLVGHNMAFDMACVMSTWPELQDLVFSAYDADGVACTETRERLLNIATGEAQFHTTDDKTEKSNYTLSDVYYRYCGKKLEKGDDTWRLRYGELDDVPENDWPQEAILYAKKDAICTHEVYLAQEGRKREISYDMPTEFFEARAALSLQLMKSWGLLTNKTKVQNLWDSSNALLSSKVGELVETGLLVRDKKGEVSQSMKRTKQLIIDSYPGGDPSRTEKGNIITAQNVIEECNDSNLSMLVEYKKLEKTLSTYVSKMFGDIIHPGLIGLGCRSTRTSCRAPNIQNQPTLPGVRECYEPRPGYCFLESDYDSQEMRTLAQMCLDLFGQSRLAAMYQQDKHYDPHLDFAANLLGIPIAEAKERLNAGNDEIKKTRQRSKVANFGYPGGMMPNTFVSYAKQWGVILTQQESKALRDHWLDFFPEMKLFLNYAKELPGVMTLPRGGVVRGAVGYTDGANGHFQGPGAHCTKEAMWEVSRRCYTKRDSFLYGSRPVIEVHDSIMLETPLEVGHWAAIELENVMIEAMEKWTPDVPSSASAVLMSCWSKQARPIWKNGRMIPWTL